MYVSMYVYVYVCTYVYVYVYECMCLYVRTCIQGVTGGTDQTSGECSLGQTIPI